MNKKMETEKEKVVEEQETLNKKGDEPSVSEPENEIEYRMEEAQVTDSESKVEEKNDQSIQEKKYKRKNRILILILLLLLGCIGWYVYQDHQEKQGLRRQGNAELGFLPGMTDEEIQAEMDKKVTESELAISINSQLIFPSGSEEGFIRIENNANNHYLLMVEIYRKDNDEMIYQSGAIDPGYYLEKDKLLVNLKKGTYPVTVKFKAYHVDTEAFIGEAQANSEVVIEK